MSDYSTSAYEEQGYTSATNQERIDATLKDVGINAPEVLPAIVARQRRRGAERSGALGYSHISGRGTPEAFPKVDTGVVEIYENDVVVKRPGPAFVSRGDRGDVHGMSQASHNRMVQMMNWLRWPEGLVLFCTVTWPDEFPRDEQTVNADGLITLVRGFEAAHAKFRALQKRLERQFSDCEFFWRREWKARKTGVNAGVHAPHYHFFLFLAGADELEVGDFLRCAWTDLTYNGSSDYLAQLEHGTDCVPITDRGHACRYISKYMAKLDAGDYFATGRAWGHSNGLDFRPYAVFRYDAAQILLIRWLLSAVMWAREMAYARRFDELPEAYGFHVYLPAGAVFRVLLKLKQQPLGSFARSAG